MTVAANEPGPRWPLLLALLGTIALATPWLFGAGVDVPDDALYYHVASWEWLRHALTHDTSPWFVPGKLGGVSLFADAMPMGPFYPAAWSLFVLPVWVAFPVACLLHGVAALLTTRWLARTLGASPMAATLAGAAVALGPLGAMGFVDCRADSWALVVWLPVAFGAMERYRRAPEGRRRLRWVALAAMSLGLVALGSHLRLSAAGLAAFGLWALVSGLPLRATIAALVLGTMAGAPGFLPSVLEWGQASGAASASGRFEFLAQPVQTGLDFSGLPGLLTPRPQVSYADYSVGALLGLALILGIGRGALRLGREEGEARPAGRMALLAMVLLLAAFSPSIPGLRLLFAPLLMLSHPVNDPWLAVAVVLVAAPAAVALDGLARQEQTGSLLRGPRGAVLVALLGGALAMLLLGAYRDGHGRLLYAVGLVQCLAAVGLALWLLVRRRPRRLLLLLVVIGLLDLGLFAARMYGAVPSQTIDLRHRTSVEGLDRLADGYVDIDDLSRLESFVYEPPDDGDEPAPDEPEEFWEDTAATIQQEIALRAWPAHFGMAHGLRALNGRAKLAPSRQVAMLMPLAEELRFAGMEQPALDALFGSADGLGSRTLALHGIPMVARPDGRLLPVGPGLPRCSSPARLELEADPQGRIARLLSADFELAGDLALVEEPAHEARPAAVAQVDCSDGGIIEVEADGEAVVILRERHHAGWRVSDADGDALDTFAVNQVHTGVRLPAGTHTLTVRFVPPGLHLSWASAALAWLVVLLLGLGSLRRRS